MASPWGAANGYLLALLREPAQCHPTPPPPIMLDWEYLVRAAHLHGVSPIVHAGTEGMPEVPDTARDALHSAYWTTHFRNRALLAAIEEILHGANERGISVMPLKGALLASHYYSVPALRPMSDLDLLVRPHDLERFAALLIDQGYSAVEKPKAPLANDAVDPLQREYAYTKHDGISLLTEFRAEPLDPVGMGFLALDRRLTERLQEHARGIWERSGTGRLGDAPFARMAPEDLILHVASHLTTRHTNFRLLWLYDLSVIIAQHPAAIDWSRMMHDAAAIKLDIPVLAALEAARDLIGAAVPVAALRGLTVPRFAIAARTEHRLFMRQAKTMPDADLTSIPMMPVWLTPTALFRLHGVRAPLRAVCSLIIPSRGYMTAWAAESGLNEIGYGRALLLRLLLTMIRFTALASAHIPARPTARLIRRAAERAAAALHVPLVPPDRNEASPQRWL